MRVFAAAVAFLLAVWPVLGHGVELPNHDALALAVPDRTVAEEGLLPGERILHGEPRLGLPTFVWAAFAAQPAAAGQNWEQLAYQQVRLHAALYRLDDRGLGQLRLRALHDTGRGAVVVSFGRTVEGVDVFRDELRVVLDRAGRLVALTGYLAPDHPGSVEFEIDPAGALALAAADLGVDASAREFTGAGSDDAGFALFQADFLDREARIRPVYFHLPGRLVPAWHIELAVDGGLVAQVIDAAERTILYRRNLVQDFSYRVWADAAAGNLPFDGPQGTAGTPHPTALPDGWQANPIAPSLISLRSGPISSGDPWLAAGATETLGNNVDAYTDSDPPDGRNGKDRRASTTAAEAFDRRFDLGQGPSASEAQSLAAVTHLFYVSNYLHDWFYDAGFDEAARNAQEDNLRRGGAAGDRLLAEAQDWSGNNNASMGTPADGGKPRMQMMIFFANFARRASVVAPAAAATSFAVELASFGPQDFDVTGPLVVMDDGDGVRSDGCQAPIVDLSGAIVLIDRGLCPFSEKVQRAAAAGAIGVIIANNEAGNAPGMGGDDPGITIGAVSLSRTDANSLRAMSGVTVQLLRERAIDRDSALDTTVVAHEFAHMVTNRLVGDSAGLGNNQGGALGEGWSDFAALLFLAREDDRLLAANVNFSGAYAIGGWVSSGGGNRGYYYGMRRYPYSVDFTRNPLTFAHIENNVELPGSAPYAYGRSGRINAESHRSGEVWATMLWECYVSLLRDGNLNFPEARQRMLDLLVASLKITPNDPTILEARDAMLAAAWASEPAEYALFLQAFARRGAGRGAVAPDRWSFDHAGTMESFEAGHGLELLSIAVDDRDAGCDHDGILDAGETAQLILRLRNDGIGALNATTLELAVNNPNFVFTAGNRISLPPSQPLQIVEVSVPITLVAAAEAELLELQIVASDPAMQQPRTFSWGTWAHFDEAPARARTDSMEGARTVWTTAGDGSMADAPWRRIFVEGEGFRWHGPTTGLRADQYLITPPLQVSASTPLRLSFRHRHSFEAREGAADGGVLEITTDGTTWNQIEAAYGGVIHSNGTNPLRGRRAFIGESSSWPGLQTEVVELGTAFIGEAVRFRFRVASDAAIGGHGWEIDDIAIEGIDNQPFPAILGEDGSCENRGPVAVITAPFAIDERAEVRIDGAESHDADWDRLSFRWTQLEGPAVAWIDTEGAAAHFIAPEVTSDEAIVLRLEVGDGTEIASTTARIIVRQVNRAPVASARGPSSVRSGEAVQLDGSTSFDPDGDPIVHRWTQIDGVAVRLDDRTAVAPRFTAPGSGSRLRFSLVVSDGDQESVPGELAVDVLPENGAPVVVAGPSITADERARVQLVEGSANDPDGDALTWNWSQVAGTQATIEDPRAAEPWIVLPDVEADETLIFSVTVSDGTLGSEAAQVEVHVREVNRPPVVVTLPQIEARPGQRVVIDASGSEDPDGEEISFAFRQLEGRQVALEDMGGGMARFSAPSDSALLLFAVDVEDTRGGASTAEVVVRVSKVETDPGACGCSGGGASAGIQLAGWAVVAGALRFRRRRSA